MSLATGAGAGPQVRMGAVVTVRVPATSANLGPGFDSLGLALGLYDDVRVEVTPSGLDVAVTGEGAAAVPGTEEHLVVRAVRAGLEHAGAAQPGLRLVCHNGIPHGRGLGSSAAAVVAGLLAARACLADPLALDDTAVLGLATRFEGHPDNAAAALLGGLTISWEEPGQARAVRLEVHPDVEPVLFVPQGELSTSRARSLLPEQVPHGDAAFNAGRAALLVEALRHRPELLLAATADRLHQDYRAEAMAPTLELVGRLRAAGAAAVVSGAGPSVLVLAAGPRAAHRAADAADEGWRVLRPGMATRGAQLTTEGAHPL